jgi:Xaa-Pro aminopeptidase
MKPTLCLHASSEDANFLYATGMHVPDPAFWFQRGHRSYLVASALELGRAQKEAAVTHVLDEAQWTRKVKRRLGRAPRRTEVYAAILVAKKVHEVVVPADFPVGTADELRAAGIDVGVQEPPYFPQRVVKRDDEIAAVRAAQAANERALEAALDILRAARSRGGWLRHGGERVTSEMLRGAIELALAREGLIAKHTIVASGEQGVDPHDSGSGPIRPNRPIIIDIFPRDTRTGYFADMTRTVVRGKASKQVREIYDVVHRGQQYAFDRLHGGCDAQAIHQGIRDLFTDAGWPTGKVDGRNQGFFHGTGHGVGLDIHEPPSFGDRPSTIPSGAIVTVEPGLYYPGIGGVRLEDMVLVTDDGCENLTHAPKVLEL